MNMKEEMMNDAIDDAMEDTGEDEELVESRSLLRFYSRL